MDEIKNRLVREARRNLAGHGSTRWAERQQAEWGGWRIPWWLTMLVFTALYAAMLQSDQLSLGQALSSADWLWGGGVLCAVLCGLSRLANIQLALRTYARRLRQDERFFLVEYDAYLERRIAGASRDKLSRNVVDAGRLAQARARLALLLDRASHETSVPSQLGEEIELVELALRGYAAVEPQRGEQLSQFQQSAAEPGLDGQRTDQRDRLSE